MSTDSQNPRALARGAVNENTTASGAAELPEALRLAAFLEGAAWHKITLSDARATSSELRRLHALAASAAVAPTQPVGESKLPGIVDKALEQLKSSVGHWESIRGHWDMRHVKDALHNLEWYVRRKQAAPVAPAPQPAAHQRDGVPTWQAAQDPMLECSVQPRPLSHPLAAYHSAMSKGPLHYTWQDKPHRLVYDLIAAVKHYANQAGQAAPAPVAEDADPLQGAANWLVTSHATTSATELGSRLCIGYNRAERLFNAARAQAAQPEGGEKP